MFLFVQGAKQGIIKGESEDATHVDEIEVLAWNWGMQAKGATGGGTVAGGRTTIHELKVKKKVDRASTALMAVLRNNEPLTSVKLTMRKAGKTALEFLKITLKQARLTSLEIDAGDPPGSVSMLESIAFSFNEIEVEYKSQGKDGQGKGSTLFADQFDENR